MFIFYTKYYKDLMKNEENIEIKVGKMVMFEQFSDCIAMRNVNGCIFQIFECDIIQFKRHFNEV